TPATHYASEQACLAARAGTLMANNDLDFPMLVAECLPVARKASSAEPASDPLDSQPGSNCGVFSQLVGVNYQQSALAICRFVDFAREFRSGMLPALIRP